MAIILEIVTAAKYAGMPKLMANACAVLLAKCHHVIVARDVERTSVLVVQIMNNVIAQLVLIAELKVVYVTSV